VVDVTMGGQFEASPGRDFFVVDVDALAALPASQGDEPGPRLPVLIIGFDPAHDYVVVEHAQLGPHAFIFDASSPSGSLHIVESPSDAIVVQDDHFAGHSRIETKVGFTPAGGDTAHTDITIPLTAAIGASSFYNSNVLVFSGDFFP
jgi:hypothetical protein